MTEFEAYLERTTPEKRQLIELLQRCGFYEFAYHKQNPRQQPYLTFHYPIYWDTSFFCKVRVDQLDELWVAKQLIEHNVVFQMEVIDLVRSFADGEQP